jgi:hypothetical protein
MLAFLDMTSRGWVDAGLQVLFWTLSVWVVVTLAGRLWARRDRPTARQQ